MPLYEIVLRFPDRDEVRITDWAGYRTGDETLVAGRRYLVTGTEPPVELRAERRFVLEPCDLAGAADATSTQRLTAAIPASS